ncbi:MAG: restriction endonuclease subunit S [Anaerolineae bacterium]|nr:restriction endonuclease subunit S [Anaerolineae bacterium]
MISQLPTDWNLRVLETCLSVVLDYRGKTALKATDGIPLLSAKVVHDGRIDWGHLEFIAESDYDAWMRRGLPQPNDVVITTEAPLGEVAQLDARKVALGQRIIVLRGDPKYVDNSFLKHVLMSDYMQNQLREKATGSTAQGVKQTELLKILVPLPPLAEQRKIAAILSTWDEAITLTEQLIAALKRRKQALMQLLLTGEARFSEFEDAAWQEHSFSELMMPISRPEKVRPEKEYRLIGVRWYVQGAHIHEIRQGRDIITETLSQIQENDVIYNKMWASKAAFGIARGDHNGAYGTSEYPQFLALAGELHTDFMEYVYQTRDFQYQALSLCRGSTGRARLNPNDFLKIVLPMPDIQEQQKITEVLQACDSEIDTQVQYLNTLITQKRGLMQQLLTGEIRVQVEEES